MAFSSDFSTKSQFVSATPHSVHFQPFFLHEINVGALIGTYDTWVWKSDCGSESNIEAQKGEASDAFKRACFNWGIGRELYTAPFVYVSADKCNISNGKCFYKFVVERIKVVNKHIVGLSIINLSSKQTIRKTSVVSCGRRR